MKMAHETNDNSFLEKVILFLVIAVGAILVYNQFQYTKVSSNILLNSISFFLFGHAHGLHDVDDAFHALLCLRTTIQPSR